MQIICSQLYSIRYSHQILIIFMQIYKYNNLIINKLDLATFLNWPVRIIYAYYVIWNMEKVFHLKKKRAYSVLMSKVYTHRAEYS